MLRAGGQPSGDCLGDIDSDHRSLDNCLDSRWRMLGARSLSAHGGFNREVNDGTHTGPICGSSYVSLGRVALIGRGGDNA